MYFHRGMCDFSMDGVRYCFACRLHMTIVKFSWLTKKKAEGIAFGLSSCI